jgi:hypothetical protein
MVGLMGQVLAALLGVAGGPPRRQRPSITYWPLWVAALLLAGLALIFFVLAGFFALTESLGAPLAAVLTAAGLLFLAAILVAFAVLMRPPPAPKPDPELLAVLLEKLGEGLGEQIAAKQPALTIAVALAGVALGYSPTLRRWLLSLAK